MAKKLLRKLLRAVVIFSVFAYVGAMLYLWLGQESLLFFPEPETADDAAVFADFETSFAIDGETLDGWYVPGTSGTTVVYFGGNAEELSRRVDNIIEFGPHNYLLMNYRGFGDSSGEPGEADMKADALALIAAAGERYGFSPEDAVIIGRSLGTGVATYVAASLPVKKLVLITPYDSVRAVAKGRYPIFPVALLLRHPFDSVQYVNDIDIPTLIIKATTDNVVPHIHTDALVSAWQGPLQVETLPGTHGSVVNSAQFTDTIAGFIDSRG